MRRAASSICGAMRGELLLVARPQGLDAVGDPALAAFGRAELHAALVGQRLLGRIEDLHEVAGDAALRHLVEARGDGLRRIEEIAEQQRAGEAATAAPAAAGSPAAAASPSCAASASAMREVALRLAIGGVRPSSAMRSPARTSSSAMASVSTSGAVALGDRRQVAAGTPSTARRPARARRCAPPPIRARARRDGRSWPSGASRSRWPGRCAWNWRNCQKVSPVPGAAAAVDAVRHRIGDAQGLEHQLGQAVGERLRLAFEREDAARAGLWPLSSRSLAPPPVVTPALLPSD